MQNHEGIKVDAAGPSTPVEVVGWRDMPTPGDIILEVESEVNHQDFFQKSILVVTTMPALG